MGTVNNAIMTVEELFEKAKTEYEYWVGEMEKYGFNSNDSIVAAQYYGQMCAFAEVNRILLGDDVLRNTIQSMTVKLYKGDYKRDYKSS